MRSKSLILVQTLSCLLLALALLPGAAAAQVKTFVVFPFTYTGPTQYQYYGKGASSRISRKLTVPGTLEPAQDEVALQMGLVPPANGDEVRKKLAGGAADYLVWGDIGVVGNDVALKVTLQSLTADPIVLSSKVPMDEVTLELDSMAGEMTNKLFNKMSKGSEEAKQAQSPAAANPAFLDAQNTEDSYTASAANPQFRYEGGSQNTGRWQSQGLRFISRGMVVCDALGNGKNEIFLLKEHSVEAYVEEQGMLKSIAEQDFGTKAETISIASIDLEKDGARELVITCYRDDAPAAYIYRFNGTGFTPVIENVHMFLNVVRMPPTYTPVLIGQPRGFRELFDNYDVREVYVSGNGVISGRKVGVPPFANLYNFAYLPVADSYKFAMLDTRGHIQIFSPDLKADSTSEETYNSSAIPLPLPTSAIPSLGESNRDVTEQQYYYVPMPMLPTNVLTGTDKYELLLNRDISVASQVFKRFRTFTQGEIHSMFWDGTGMNLAWKTRRIKGTVVCYDVADYNNDGKPDLLVLVNTYPGAIQMNQRKTVLFAYDLNLQQ